MGICSGISTKSLFIHCFQIELEFRSRDENQQQKLNPHMTTGPRGIEPRPHWWEASALTAAPSLLSGLIAVKFCIIRTFLEKGCLGKTKKKVTSGIKDCNKGGS